MLKKLSGFIKSVLMLCVCAGIGYFISTHPQETQDVIEKSRPVVKKVVQKTIPVAKNLAEKAGAAAKNALNYIKEESPKSQKKAAVEDENSEELTVSSFNIRIFSDKSRDDEELATIVNILKEYDIVAIQELRDEKVMKRARKMLKNMGYSYDYEMSEKVGRGVKEQYAFLYKKDKVKLITKGQLYPEIGDEFIREPYYATFKSGNFDFTLVTVHVLFGKSKTDRRPELKELAKVYRYIQDKDPDEQDIILLGDFNFSPTDRGWADLKKVSTMKYVIKPPSKTTIQDSSLYDNIWFQDEHVKEYTNRVGIYKFDEKLFDNDDKVASKTVSDHRPIWGRFNTAGEDDD